MSEITEPVEQSCQDPELAPYKGPAVLRALRNRNFAYFWVGLMVSATGSWMQNVAHGWLIYELTHSKVYLGIVAAASQLPFLLLTLPAGVLADRFSKRRIVLFTQTGLMLSALGLAADAYSGLIQPWHILVFSTLNGCLYAFDVPARQSMMVELVGKNDLVNAVALNSAAFNGARLVGPAIAGAIIATSGAAACFLINGISFAAVIAGLLMIRGVTFWTRSGDGSMASEIVDGLKYVISNKVIRDLLILSGIATIFVAQYAGQMPAMAREVLKVGPKGLGILVSSAGLGAVIAALAVACLGHVVRQGALVISGCILTSIAMIALSFSTSLPTAAACMAVVGFGMMVFLAVSNSLIQMASPDKLCGRVLAARTLVFFGLGTVGSLQVGILAQRFGIAESLRIGAIVSLAVALYFAFRSEVSRASGKTVE